MNKNERRHLGCLQKRLDFLEKRVAASPQKDLTYDKQEATALKFAIECIQFYDAVYIPTPNEILAADN